MMVAMMLPSATPMVLPYAWIGRATAFDTNPIGPTGWFAAGYLLIWFAFALPPPSTMGARTRRVAYTDGEHEQFCWRYPFDRPAKSIKLRAVDGGNKSTRKCYWAYWNSGLSLKAFFVAPGRTNLLSTNLN
jgi:hypothetical protein